MGDKLICCYHIKCVADLPCNKVYLETLGNIRFYTQGNLVQYSDSMYNYDTMKWMNKMYVR